jgi:1-acyl-sn-glycerol-3-phosphate acyltransferase
MNTWMSILGVATLVLVVVTGFLFSLRWWVQSLVRVLLLPRYRLRIIGREHIPPTGPVLIAANHVTWLDGFFLAAACPRRGHALVNAAYIEWPVIGRWARWIGLIPVRFSGPKAQRTLFEVCRKVLDEGGVLGLFPEAQMTRNGLTGPFYRGLEVILAGRNQVAVVPMFLENLWGSVFSYAGGRVLGRRPRGARRTVVVVFGPPISRPLTAFAVRQAVLEAGVTACEHRGLPLVPLATLDPSLPHIEHSCLGPLTGSTANHDQDGIRQTGHKPETLGQPLPGVALRVVNDAGEILPPETAGRLLARIPCREWTDTGYRASLDRDGFVRILQ